MATTSDLPPIVAIYNEAVEAQKTADIEPVSIAERQTWLAQHPADHYPVYVFEDENKINGWLSISPWRPGREALSAVGEVSFFVRKSHFRQGIGSRLLQHAIDEAPKLGMHHFIAILLANNVPSIQLLEKFGFSPWGHLPEVAQFGKIAIDQMIYGKQLCPTLNPQTLNAEP